MSERLGQALVRHIEKSVGVLGDNDPAWLLIEGVSPDVAESIAVAWPEALPELFISGPPDREFKGRSLDGPATRLRNSGALCLVLCEGTDIPDGQSIKAFDRFSPVDLARAISGLTLLAASAQDVTRVEAVPTVLEALVDPKLERPPSPLSVSRYLDEIAAGRSPGEALPLLGGFRDVAQELVTVPRVVDNLNLAMTRSSAERLKPSALGEIRSRAEAKPVGGLIADEVIDLIRRQDPQILSSLSFDEAAGLLEEPAPASLQADVKSDLDRYRVKRSEAISDWSPVDEAMDQLSDHLDAKQAAAYLLRLDADHQEGVFQPAVRRRLRNIRREKSIAAASIEEGLLRAIESLPSTLHSIELKEPALLDSISSEAQARNALSLATVHVRLAPLLAVIGSADVKIAGELLADPGPSLRGVSRIIDHPASSKPRRVVISIRGEGRGHRVEVGWTPSPEDFALLMASVGFSDAVALSLKASTGLGAAPKTASMEPLVPPDDLAGLAMGLQRAATGVLQHGYDVSVLRGWAKEWSKCVETARTKDQTEPEHLDALAQAGAMVGDDGDLTLTHFSPLKAEWVADRTDAWLELTDQVLRANSGDPARETGDEYPLPFLSVAKAIADASAAQFPGFVLSSSAERPQLASSDGSVLSSFGSGESSENVAPFSPASLISAIEKFVALHPEASENFRCVALRDSGADLLLRAVHSLMSRGKSISRAELVLVGGSPRSSTLATIDEWARGDNRGRISLRYIDDLKDLGRHVSEGPDFHLATIEGITTGPARVRINMEQVPAPPPDDQGALFIPKTWVRPGRSNLLLAPPAMSPTTLAWHRLMTAFDEAWPTENAPEIRVAEIRTDLRSSRDILRELHALAQWVVSFDRFATRESVKGAVGSEVAILHQEQRTSGSVVQGMVISQRVAGTADRAIERSLRRASLADETTGATLAEGLREAATRGYGILALRAATTGSGINELIGHVAGFSRLVTDATPWPLPPGCRVLLLSLDEYASWFGRSQRADMLALAISPDEKGVHAANVEVKAVRSASAAKDAMSEAKEQIRKTLVDSRFAIKPNGSIYSRLWLNRICEAAVSVARETDVHLSEADLQAIDQFRRGDGVLEWAGIAMVFAPQAEETLQHIGIPLLRDRIPVALSTIELSNNLLTRSASVDGTNMKTVESGRPVLRSSSKTRTISDRSAADDGPVGGKEGKTEGSEFANEADSSGPNARSSSRKKNEPSPDVPDLARAAAPRLVEPSLGTDAMTGETVLWKVSGTDVLSNGHMEVYGTSGAGKTQFIMSLLRQLQGSGAHFGVCDFKNDYAGDFPERSGAAFYDLWDSPLPYNPLAIADPTRRSLQSLIIELRDTVEIAARPYARLGHRQLGKLQEALEQAFGPARQAGPAPTLIDVHERLDEDLRGVIGDLTGTELFGSGPPLGDLIEADAIFGLNHIPGTGLTTTLAAGFILSSLYLKLLEMPQVANTVNYVAVIDEAHRVANFHSVASMVRELRSKGLAVILATQKPGDLPDEASTNAQTKVYLRLPDAQSARTAARALDPADKGLADSIRTLGNGEAFVAIAGGQPRMVKLRQYWRDG